VARIIMRIRIGASRMQLNKFSDTSLSVILFFSASLWGLYWLPLRTIENAGVTGAWSIAYLNALPLIVLVPVLIYKHRLVRVNFGACVLASVALVLGFTFYATGLVTIPVVRATLLFYLTPIWSTILGVFWLSEPLGKGRIIAIVMGLTGLALLLTQADAASQPLQLGDVFALLSGVFWAFGAAMLKRYPETPILTITTYQFAATTGFSIFIAVFVFGNPTPEVAALGSVFAVTLGSSVLILLPAVYLIFRIAQILYPGRVGVLMMSEVLVTILSAWILLPEETMTLLQWVGAAVIISAALVEIASGAQAPSPGPKAALSDDGASGGDI